MITQLIRSRRDPSIISILLRMPAPGYPQGMIFEAFLFGRDAAWIQEHCDIIPVPELSGETYEVITLTPKTPAPAPENHTTHADP